jgi:hypothetical protein
MIACRSCRLVWVDDPFLDAVTLEQTFCFGSGVVALKGLGCRARLVTYVHGKVLIIYIYIYKQVERSRSRELSYDKKHPECGGRIWTGARGPR